MKWRDHSIHSGSWIDRILKALGLSIAIVSAVATVVVIVLGITSDPSYFIHAFQGFIATGLGIVTYLVTREAEKTGAIVERMKRNRGNR